MANNDFLPLRTKNLLHIENLYKVYGDRTVLDNVDLSVSQGEICTVVGPSGCGKSTLLRIIVGQESPTAGEVLIEGAPAGYPDHERGIVYQKYALFPHLTALENVLLGRDLDHSIVGRRRARRLYRDEAMHFLERARIADHCNKFPHELSGGMQQRVAIAQTLIKNPRIVLMDEPFGALDPGVREDMQLFLLELWEEHKMTIFFVTHDLEEALYLGTRCIVLSQYYTDDRVQSAPRGARIVADYALPRHAVSTVAKTAPEFGQLIQRVRHEGFDPSYRAHVREFNLKHPDSFQTLLPQEDRTFPRATS